MRNNIENIIALLNPDNTISAHRLLAHAIGMTETVIYSALISKQTFYSKCNMLAEDGWFYSTIYDLQESTTFGVKAQTTAIKHLVEFGLIECITKGLPAKRYFRIITDVNKIKQLIEKGKEIVKKFSAHTKSSVPDKREEVKNDIVEGKLQFAPSAKACSRRKVETCLSPANNKTKDIKPKINKSVYNQSVNQRNKADDDRLTEHISKRYKFSEVLKMLGVDWRDLMLTEPKSENALSEYDEDMRRTRKCVIPYYLKEDRSAVKTAIEYVSGYSYYLNDKTDPIRRDFFKTVIDAITEMVHFDKSILQGRTVMYYEVIDRLNEIISTDYFISWLYSFEDRWKEVVANNNIKHKRSYIKPCIWSWLNDYNFESYNELAGLEMSYKVG